jgi:hypothetical protein
LVRPGGQVHQHQFHAGFRRHCAVAADEVAQPRQLQALARQHPAAQVHGIAMQQGLAVLDAEGYHGQFQSFRRQIGIGQSRRLQRFHTRFLQPGQIRAVPHHAGVVGVLRQHPALQSPGSVLVMLRHGLFPRRAGPLDRP